jgi:hypothetical protein
MPVEPTVPSKMREPVCGCKRPASSAMRMTVWVRELLTEAAEGVLCNETRSLTLPPGLRNWARCSTRAYNVPGCMRTSHLPCMHAMRGCGRSGRGAHQDLDAGEFR